MRGGCHTNSGLTNYTIRGTKPQMWLYHLKGRGSVSKNNFEFNKKKEPKKRKWEGWKKNKGKTFYNRGSGLSRSHRQCGFYQGHAMLVPICQLRLHVNQLRQGKYRGTWRCLFAHKRSSRCRPRGIRRIGFQQELLCHDFSPYDIFRLNKMPTNDL